jgi:DAACS family dicarboxylate/amino acid:cation (Na+ or H+) symporter
VKRPIPLSLQIIAAMLVGGVVGPLLGARAAALGEIGRLVIQLIKAAATPLLFFAIVQAILKTEVKGRAGLRMLTLATLNAAVAVTIGILLSNLFRPGTHLGIAATAAGGAGAATYADKKIDVMKVIGGFIPTNLIQPFAENVVLAVVMLALLFGFALRRLRREDGAEALRAGAQVIEDAVTAMQRVMEILLGWVIRLVPLAVFGVVAKTIAEHGLAPVKGLAAYLGVGLLGMALHVALWYQLLVALAARTPLRRFWGVARDPMVYAIGANSSLATLPLTLGALDRLKVSRQSSALGACVGTNFNNDGIILYEGMAVLFVAQAHGLELDLGQQLLSAGACLVAAMGVAGIPEAGFISLALVLNTVGLPVEILPLLLTVDWVLGRARSGVNTLSDMVLSLMIDRGFTDRRPP